MKDRMMLCSLLNLKEAAYEASTGKLTVTVIKPGFNTSKSRFYTEKALRTGHKMFEGAKMFVNHQTDQEAKNRPEGDINQWVANLTKTWNESDGTIKGEAVVIDPPFKAKLDKLAENKMLSEMGVSIRAVGQFHNDVIEGAETKVVENFIGVRSVDFVTYPGAGGRVEAIESERDDVNDVDLVTAEMFEARRPDIVAGIRTKLKQEMTTEMKTAEQLTQELAETNIKLVEANTKLATESAARTAAETKVQEAEKAQRVATASVELGKLLTESKLPKLAQDRLRKQFATAEKIDGMKEAIVAEVEYIKAIGGSTKKITKMGEAHNEDGDNDDSVDLVKTFMATGLSKEAAELAANGL